MQKIPTIFERDWDGDRSRVTSEQNPDCAWVFAGEGHATIKLDGACAAVRDGALWKRREISHYKPIPAGFEPVSSDPLTERTIGWLPVGDGPEDKWFREAWRDGLEDGTYELVGPKVQGGIESDFPRHTLVRHGSMMPQNEPPRDFDGLREWLFGMDIEGIVWHHPDGRMAKIKLRDFGLERGVTAPAA